MENIDKFRQFGLFDAKVPRYTSYPPANRFAQGIGAQHQKDWLEQTNPDNPVSVYIHIPFCRRLCWFCACRTQGTKTLAPVEAYVETLLEEITQTCNGPLPADTPMRRLHLGGGTPTLLSGDLMRRLLTHVFDHFPITDDFEFSVEIDPTEAADETLDVLAAFGMARASIGVQDFDPQVQAAIGREQSFILTRAVIERLRAKGVQSLNIDFLYGLPHQTAISLADTLDQVVALKPDRLALYGYAHVPHVSKRQVMIPADALPNPEERYALSELARTRLIEKRYIPIGLDHFALPHDSLTIAAKKRSMIRNFQGYTDDPCPTLLGFGASAISKFPDGYVQNAVATSAYTSRIQSGGLAGHKGIVLSDEDQFIATIINALMCYRKFTVSEVVTQFPHRVTQLHALCDDLMSSFPGVLGFDGRVFSLSRDNFPLVRLIAAHIDQTRDQTAVHSLAI